MKISIIYLIILAAVSLLTFLFFAGDKKQSGRESNGRIPEMVLLSLMGFGGALGGLGGMYILRHKTNFSTKFHFGITVWLAAAVQIALAVWLFVKV